VNKYIDIGRVNTLTITRVSQNGLYLSAEDTQEVLLPNRYMNSCMQIGDIIEVFVYRDSEDRLVATTKYPYAILNAKINAIDPGYFR